MFSPTTPPFNQEGVKMKEVWVVTFIRDGQLYYEPAVFTDQIQAANQLNKWRLDHTHKDGDLTEVIKVGVDI